MKGILPVAKDNLCHVLYTCGIGTLIERQDQILSPIPQLIREISV
jgi:hypothetical protein